MPEMDTLLYFAKEFRNLSRAGWTHVEANYDIDKLNDRLMEIYKGLLK